MVMNIIFCELMEFGEHVGILWFRETPKPFILDVEYTRITQSNSRKLQQTYQKYYSGYFENWTLWQVLINWWTYLTDWEVNARFRVFLLFSGLGHAYNGNSNCSHIFKLLNIRAPPHTRNVNPHKAELLRWYATSRQVRCHMLTAITYWGLLCGLPIQITTRS